MANTPKEKTAKQKAVDAAYKALTNAREALEKSATANNKTALAHAETAYNAAKDAERRERFSTVGRDRAELVLVKLAAFEKCANKKAYEFTAADIDKAETAFNEAVVSTIATFRAALTGKAPTAKGGRLNFD